MKKIKITESQYNSLQEQVVKNFVSECETMGSKQPLTESEVLNEAFIGDLAGKLAKVFKTGGVPALKNAVLAASASLAMAGVTSDALAQSMNKVGVPAENVKEITNEFSKSSNKGDFSKELSYLTQSYVIDDNDPNKTKQHMKFVGDISDVVGISNNGFPVFKTGSKSEIEKQNAFKNPKIINGIVNIKGKDFKGKFVKANGLFYNYVEPTNPPKQEIPVDSTVTKTNTKQEPFMARETPKQEGYHDFTGLIQQGKQRFEFKRGVDNLTGQPKRYGSFEEYIYDFVRSQGKNMKNYSNDELDELFANGLKVPLSKLKK